MLSLTFKEKKFKKFNLINEKDLSLERWTLDDKNDFEVIKKIVKNFRNFNFD